MGFFSNLVSKKTITCERCGNTYEARVTIGEHLCPACKKVLQDKKDNVLGYTYYTSKMSGRNLTEQEMDTIAVHRDSILERYRNANPLTPDRMKEHCDSYKNLSDDQAAAVLNAMSNSSYDVSMGACFTGGFYALTGFPKVVIDVRDVFAVGITSLSGLKVENGEAILCAVFTNDPYIPVFPMVYGGKLGFFEIMKSKKGRKGVAALFELTCPNLQYPVMEMKKLKKQIKADGAVRGNISMDKMLDYLDDAEYASGIFKASEQTPLVYPQAQEMLASYGYYDSDTFRKIINDSGMFAKRFWQKQIKRLADYDLN